MKVLDIKYPPRKGWDVVQASPSLGFLHRGYYTKQLRPCPCCHRRPVFEEATRFAADPGQPAKIFVGICPVCELRTKSDGSLRTVVMQWQRGEYSKASWGYNHRLWSPDINGVRRLCKYVVGAAIDDAMIGVRRRNDVSEDSSEFDRLGDNLEALERFFNHSVFMWELNPDGVFSEIRRALYPELEPHEREQIPLHLSQLYKGKAVVIRKCQKKNFSGQLSDEVMHELRQRSAGLGKIKRKAIPKTI